MEQHRDEQIVCAMCGASFVFSAAEAAVYTERGLAPPKRCRECRRARKEQRGQQDDAQRRVHDRGLDARAVRPRAPRYTGDVNEYRSPMPDAYAGAAWSAPPRARGPRVLHDDGIYRAPSFGGESAARHAAPRGEPPRRAGAGPGARQSQSRPMFSITCKSCGSEGQVPFKPIEGRDVFCQTCYRARKSA
jgi:CxxC-x17-CxxC domain-containing protein